MRSDYYDGISREPLRPLPPRRKKRPKKRRLILFFLILALLVGGSLGLALGMRWYRQSPPPNPSPSPEVQKTSIPRLPPPGEGTLRVVNGAAEALDPTEIYEKVNPSIVTVAAMDEYGRGGEGTGVIFDSDGYFVTNAHVIENTSMVQVTLSNGRVYPAHLIGMDSQTDLAVLRCSTAGLTAATFGSDADLKVGEPAYALGNPLGSRFRGTMTDGIISAINRNVYIDDEDIEMTLIQTTAALNTGNSGGALVDSRGYVIGITNMKMMSSGNTVEGLGFAIPTSTVEEVVNMLMTHGHVVGRPMLGITVQPNRNRDGSGLLVVEVEEASDAWAKGIREGDVLLTANGAYLAENDDLLRAKEGLQAGDGLLLRWRSAEGGQEQEAEILLVEQYQLTGD